MSRASEGGLAQCNRGRLIGLGLWQTIRVGFHHTVLSRVCPLAWPLFSVRRRTASSSIAMRAAMSSFQQGEPARFGLCRATHGHYDRSVHRGRPVARRSAAWR
jgi:hypothetical protein